MAKIKYQKYRFIYTRFSSNLKISFHRDRRVLSLDGWNITAFMTYKNIFLSKFILNSKVWGMGGVGREQTEMLFRLQIE